MNTIVTALEARSWISIFALSLATALGCAAPIDGLAEDPPAAGGDRARAVDRASIALDAPGSAPSPGAAPVAAERSTCRSDCSAGDGAPIHVDGCAVCAVDHASLTCDGVVHRCAPASTACAQGPRPVEPCAAGWRWCGCPDPRDPLPRRWVCGVCR